MVGLPNLSNPTANGASLLTDFQWRACLAVRYHFTPGRKRKFF
jgi:hypothetical protein